MKANLKPIKLNQNGNIKRILLKIIIFAFRLLFGVCCLLRVAFFRLLFVVCLFFVVACLLLVVVFAAV